MRALDSPSRGIMLCVFWSGAEEQDTRHSFILSNNAHYTFSQVPQCSKSLEYISSNNIDCRQQKEVMKTLSLSCNSANKPKTLHLYRLAHAILCAIRVSRFTIKRDRIKISLPSLIPLNSVPLVQRTIWQPAFKRQTHKVFMCVPGVQWVQTATEEFIKGGERIVKCIKFKPRPNKKRLKLNHRRRENQNCL